MTYNVHQQRQHILMLFMAICVIVDRCKIFIKKNLSNSYSIIKSQYFISTDYINFAILDGGMLGRFLSKSDFHLFVCQQIYRPVYLCSYISQHLEVIPLNFYFLFKVTKRPI